MKRRCDGCHIEFKYNEQSFEIYVDGKRLIYHRNCLPEQKKDEIYYGSSRCNVSANLK